MESEAGPQESHPELERWSRAAETWIPESQAISEMTGGATEGLVGALAPAAGERVVDIASGPGEPSLSLARAVGPSGRVLAVDGVPAMSAELARRAAEAGLTWLETASAPAEQVDLEAGSADLISCRFGAMFFDDPEAVARRLLTGLVPGGRMAWMVWGPAPSNPYFTLCSGALDAAGVEAPAPGEGLHGVFELAEDDVLARAFRAAGLVDVAQRDHAFAMRLAGVSPEQLLAFQAERSPVLGERVDAASPEQVRRASDAVAAAARAWRDGDGLALPALALIVSGRSPG